MEQGSYQLAKLKTKLMKNDIIFKIKIMNSERLINPLNTNSSGNLHRRFENHSVGLISENDVLSMLMVFQLHSAITTLFSI